MEEKFQIHFLDNKITLIAQTDKDVLEIPCRPIFLMSTNRKMLNKPHKLNSPAHSRFQHHNLYQD